MIVCLRHDFELEEVESASFSYNLVGKLKVIFYLEIAKCYCCCLRCLGKTDH